MGERKVFHTHQMLELSTNQRHNQIYPDNSLVRRGNNVCDMKQAVNSLQSDTGNNFYADLHSAAQSSLNEPYILPSASRGNVSILWNSMAANCLVSPDNGSLLVDNYAGNAHLIENAWQPFRRESVQQDCGSYLYFNGSRSSELSFPYFSQSFASLGETSANVPKHSAFVQPEYRGSRISQAPGGSLRSFGNRLNSMSTPPQPAYMYYSKDFLLANLASQSFQPTSTPWMAENGSIIVSGDHPCWSYTNPMLRSHGEGTSTGSLDMASTTQAYKHLRPTSSPSTLHLSHEDILLAQSMQAHGGIGPPQFPMSAAFYPQPLNNLQPNNLNPSTGFQSGPGLLSFMSAGEQMYRPPVQLVQGMGDGSGTRLSLENPASLEPPMVYEAVNTIDEHSDMRLDIDGMTYEELLALEERIGDVKTGLAEECILKNLKESIHAQKLPYSLSDNETCVICQVEYEDRDRLGILNCGHKFHSPCIRQWLQVKNLCPICKITAFSNS